MIVVDASAAVTAMVNAGTARDLLARVPVHAPHLVDTEVASAFRRKVGAGEISAEAAWAALAVWQRLGVVRYPAFALLGRVWELRENASAYDATYLALAESLGCELVTADARIAGVPGIRCPVTVVPG